MRGPQVSVDPATQCCPSWDHRQGRGPHSTVLGPSLPHPAPARDRVLDPTQGGRTLSIHWSCGFIQTQHLLRMEGKSIWGQAGTGDKSGWEVMHGWDWGVHKREPVGWARPVWGGPDAGSMQEAWLDPRGADPSRWRLWAREGLRVSLGQGV